MNSRKLCCCVAMTLAALAGCRRQQSVSVSDPYTPEKVAAKPGEDPASSYRTAQPKKKIEQVTESKQLDAKPENIVKIADVQAQVALDAKNTADHRQSSSKLAKQNYKRALQIDDKCLPAYQGLARLCTANGDHEQALATIDAGLAKLPKAAALWYEKGMVKGRQKQFVEAIDSLNKAYQLESDNPQFTKSIGLMLARLGDGEEAIGWLRRSMSEADAHYNVARMLRHIGQTEESDKHLQIALRVEPKHEPALTMMQELNPVAKTPPSGPTKNEGIQLAAHAPADARPPLKIVVDGPTAPTIVEPLPPSGPTAAPLPERPALPPVTATQRPLAPTIPVLSDQWEPRPVMTPSLEGPGRKKAAGKSGVQIGFEPNP